MSDRRPVAAALLALLWGATLPAQQDVGALSTLRDALRVRADSLRTVSRALDAAARDSGLVVEVRAGTLRMRTTTRLQPAADAALAQAMRDARVLLGADADSLGSHLRLALREEHTQRSVARGLFGGGAAIRNRDVLSSAALEATYNGRVVPGMSLTFPVPPTELASAMLIVMERAITHRLPAPIEPWLNHRLPLRADPADFWAELYRKLATADAASVRRCAAGERVACRLAFALDSLPANRVAAWYDDADYPALARTAGYSTQRGWLMRSMTPDDQEGCTVRGQLDVCREMLSLLPVEAFRVPMPEAARTSLTRVALEIGGPAAVERLRASGGTTVAAQLAAAAGVSADSLLTRWQQRLIAARPGSPLPDATFVLASMACIVVCGAWAVRGQPWK